MRHTTATTRRTRTALAVLAGACLTAAVLAPGTAAARPADGGTDWAVPAAGRPAPTTERVSLGAGGVQGNGPSYTVAVGPGGRSVTFLSDADNLVPGDTDGATDIFVRSLVTGRIERIELGRPGVDPVAASVSADGRTLVVEVYRRDPDTGEPRDELLVHDRRTGRTRPLLPENPTAAGSGQAVISANGRFVAFQSARSDLVPGDTNKVADIFVRDLRRGTTRRVNVYSDGTQAARAAASPTISADGGRVGFTSRTDLAAPVPEEPGPEKPGEARKPRFYPMFVHDLRTGRTVAASVSRDGTSAGATGPFLSADGRYAVYASTYTDLVPGDTNGKSDVFLRDLRRGTTTRINLAPGGAQTEGGASYSAQLSADGRTVVFESAAHNLVPGDTNNTYDLFARDLRTGAVELLTRTVDGPFTGYTGSVALDARARTVVFDSDADNLVTGDTNGAYDVFAVHRRR
ncbi:hypothetical protein NX801_14335 [Streptomyces sp. LP05-1]|uniref:Uncharacterized protein n=1 Tax=Streptomyces pyxinae TaxID=2970734 RepID=A0ABT2CHD7_9ACTN|nr:hypothetical protein [Streptomyces sp. LP05-1]MCS0636816.1 hypothetical protein [Streptomyces sp. LP05-1]